MSSNRTYKASDFTDWNRVKDTIIGIWDRHYYTNQGPLTQELEERLQDLLGVKHVICMTNKSIAIMIALKALDIERKVLLPSISHINVLQSVKWAGLEYEIIDVQPDSICIDSKGISGYSSKDAPTTIL